MTVRIGWADLDGVRTAESARLWSEEAIPLVPRFDEFAARIDRDHTVVHLG